MAFDFGESRRNMNTYTYTLINKFDSCGTIMVTVIVDTKTACTMPERDYNRIIMNERKFEKRNRVKSA